MNPLVAITPIIKYFVLIFFFSVMQVLVLMPYTTSSTVPPLNCYSLERNNIPALEWLWLGRYERYWQNSFWLLFRCALGPLRVHGLKSRNIISFQTVVVEAGCSAVSQATAQASHLWNLIQVTAICSYTVRKTVHSTVYNHFIQFPTKLVVVGLGCSTYLLT